MNRYIRLEPEEACWIKEHLKISKETFEEILKRILVYQSLRKKEIALKNKLKVSLTQLKSKINQLELSFPEDERKNAYSFIQKQKVQRSNYSDEEISKRLVYLHDQIKKNENRMKDLEDIRNKLKELNKPLS